MKDPHLITVDELREAGALDVPAAWRKSLGDDRRSEPVPGLFDEDLHTEGQRSTKAEADEDVDGLLIDDQLLECEGHERRK